MGYHRACMCAMVLVLRVSNRLWFPGSRYTNSGIWGAHKGVVQLLASVSLLTISYFSCVVLLEY